MIRGFYTAKSGLISHQEHMNTISNNIANVNTAGFKPMRTNFKDLMYQNLNRPDAQNPALVGHGIKINKNDLLMAGGPLEATGRAMDFALINENAFFAVQNAAGEINYTRAGNFYLSNLDETFYLVNDNGDNVLNADGDPIEVSFDANGNSDLDSSAFGVYRFPNYYALWAMEGTTFGQTPQSGEPELIEDPEIKASFLEGSGVDIANEMAKVVESSKAFSFSSRMLQTADEIEQTVNSLR